jgi:hypothetical protein
VRDESVSRNGSERVSRCLVALGAGRHEEAARELMEFIMVVLTPVEAR